MKNIIYNERQGRRNNMEDRVCLKTTTKGGLFASVFDGHGGDACSNYLQTYFVDLFNIVLSDLMISDNGKEDDEPLTLSTSGPSGLKRQSVEKASSLQLVSSRLKMFESGKVTDDTKTENDSSNKEDIISKCLRLTSHIMDGVLLSQAAKIIHTKSSSKIKSLTRTSKKAANEDNHLSGSTAAMVLFHLDQIYIAWVGDSRIIAVVNDEKSNVIELSTDHKASRPDEKARIRKAGGTVNSKDRLYGDLAVSRAFGDIYHKGDVLKQDGREYIHNLSTMLDKYLVQNANIGGNIEKTNSVGDSRRRSSTTGMDINNLNISNIDLTPIHELQSGALICTPDVVIKKKKSVKMIVIASDGLFDVMSNEDVVKFIYDMMGGNHNDMSKIASELTKRAEVLGSVDNISVVIVLFDQ